MKRGVGCSMLRLAFFLNHMLSRSLFNIKQYFISVAILHWLQNPIKASFCCKKNSFTSDFFISSLFCVFNNYVTFRLSRSVLCIYIHFELFPISLLHLQEMFIREFAIWEVYLTSTNPSRVTIWSENRFIELSALTNINFTSSKVQRSNSNHRTSLITYVEENISQL